MPDQDYDAVETVIDEPQTIPPQTQQTQTDEKTEYSPENTEKAEEQKPEITEPCQTDTEAPQDKKIRTHAPVSYTHLTLPTTPYV